MQKFVDKSDYLLVQKFVDTSDNLLVQKFVDTSDVYMLSTCHQTGPNGGKVKPLSFREYTLKLGAVDGHDEMTQPYDVAKKIAELGQQTSHTFSADCFVERSHSLQQGGDNCVFLEFYARRD